MTTPEEKATYNRAWQTAHPGYSSRKSKEWHDAHPERVKEYSREWYAANRETALLKDAEYRATHAEQRHAASRAWYAAHRDEVLANAVVYAITHRDELAAKRLRYAHDHPGERAAKERARRAANPLPFIEKDLRHKEGKNRWQRIEPWPSFCHVCGLAIDPAFEWPERLCETLGHEPPIAWLRQHPEYGGPLILRPEHAVCNQTKAALPDWELVR